MISLPLAWSLLAHSPRKKGCIYTSFLRYTSKSYSLLSEWFKCGSLFLTVKMPLQEALTTFWLWMLLWCACICSFLFPLLQMCWRRFSVKSLQLLPPCLSITIISQPSPALMVSATDDSFCFLCEKLVNGFDWRPPHWLGHGLFVSVLGRDVLEGIEELIPSFSGIKFSASDLMDFGQCVSYSQPHWSCLYGVDEVSLLSFWSICFVLNLFIMKFYYATTYSGHFNEKKNRFWEESWNFSRIKF